MPHTVRSSPDIVRQACGGFAGSGPGGTIGGCRGAAPRGSVGRMLRRFRQVDVFAEQPVSGNPLAVVLEADGLVDDEMQAFANWTNLSETTFVQPPSHPGADYRVRIFTTTRELPFAGHPTLGTCAAWLEAGGAPQDPHTVVQECGAGLIRIRRSEGRVAFAAPPLTRTGPLDQQLLERIIAGFGLDSADVLGASWLVNGPPWIGVRLASADLVRAVEPQYDRLKGLDVGLVGPHPPGGECAFEVRAFAYSDGAVEDPVTGSFNAGVAQWLIGEGVAPDSYVAAQGTVLGRRGRVHVDRDDDGDIWIGGAVRSVVEGTVDL